MKKYHCQKRDYSKTTCIETAQNTHRRLCLSPIIHLLRYQATGLEVSGVRIVRQAGLLSRECRTSTKVVLNLFTHISGYLLRTTSSTGAADAPTPNSNKQAAFASSDSSTILCVTWLDFIVSFPFLCSAYLLVPKSCTLPGSKLKPPRGRVVIFPSPI